MCAHGAWGVGLVGRWVVRWCAVGGEAHLSLLPLPVDVLLHRILLLPLILFILVLSVLFILFVLSILFILFVLSVLLPALVAALVATLVDGLVTTLFHTIPPLPLILPSPPRLLQVIVLELIILLTLKALEVLLASLQEVHPRLRLLHGLVQVLQLVEAGVRVTHSLVREGHLWGRASAQ